MTGPFRALRDIKDGTKVKEQKEEKGRQEGGWTMDVARRSAVLSSRHPTSNDYTMETLRIAATALSTHKLRSFLTLLGVIIGVMTVVSVVSIISGLNNYITEKVFQLNPDVYVVTQFGIITSREQFLEAVKRKKIDWDDYEAIRQRCHDCAHRSASTRTRAHTVKRGAKKLTACACRAARPNMAEINNLDLEAGRFFTPCGEHARRAGGRHRLRRARRGLRQARSDRTHDLDRRPPMRVIGLLRKQGSVLGQNQDNQLCIPINAFRKQFGIDSALDLFIRATGGVPGMERSMDDVRVILRARRRTPFRGDDPFGVVTRRGAAALWKSISAGQLRADDLHLRHLARRRRHRDHEHHAGVGRRADARDRRPPRPRRDASATSSCSS